MLTNDEIFERVGHHGFAIVEGALSREWTKRLRAAISNLPDRSEVRRRTNVYGVRNLLDICPAARELAVAPELRAIVEPVLGRNCFAVRATFFDKVPDANWKLRWHQDSVIAVKQRIDVPDFHAWSNKAGVMQVRPPFEVLANMLALRVHLDDSTRRNGPLRVLAGSHIQAWLREQIPACKSRLREIVCEVPEGGVLAMRPLLLHASAASEEPSPRRVVHIEYANGELPGDLKWHQRIRPHRVNETEVAG